MIAYKGTYNQRCRTLTYEVGKTYTYNGELKLCESGFHCCVHPSDVLYYYSTNDQFQLMEVEILGNTEWTKDKIVTDKLKVIRILTPQEISELLPDKYFVPIFKYDERNNLIYSKNIKGDEEWMEYDDQNNVIFHKDFNGYKHWKEYDKLNRLIHIKNENGPEQWLEYNDKNDVIYSKCVYLSSENFCEEWLEFDEQRNLIYHKKTGTVGEIFEKWMTYDENNRCIHVKKSSGENDWNTYDQYGNVIYIKSTYKNSSVYERWLDYDQNNNLIHFRSSTGYEEWSTYDDHHHIIYFKDTKGTEEWKEYDNRGNLKYHKYTSIPYNSNSISRFDENGNRIYYQTSSYIETCVYDKNNSLISFKNSLNNWNITIE